jgi:hypothetical protein
LAGFFVSFFPGFFAAFGFFLSRLFAAFLRIAFLGAAFLLAAFFSFLLFGFVLVAIREVYHGGLL